MTTFRKGWLDRAEVPESERAEIGAAVADRVGSNVADYVRLRFIMPPAETLRMRQSSRRPSITRAPTRRRLT